MNKLTREQADWLIERLRNQSFDLYGIHPSSRESNKGFSYKTMEDFIKQCTETQKEFPQFVLGHLCDYVISVDRIRDNPETITILTCYQESDFTPEQFKQFTEGCNKIVQWIKDNE